MPRMKGKFDTGPNKGREYEIYQDPASATGYTRKNYDPYDPNKTEYFEPFNYAAAEVDDQSAADKAAAAASAKAARTARQTADTANEAKLRQARLQANERGWNEGVRQYNEGAGLKRDQFNRGAREFDVGMDFKRDEAAEKRRVGDRDFNEDVRVSDRDFELKNLDTRTRLQIGLRQLELSEKQFGADDLRARERNVMDYVQSIGKLRLPYAELQALSQRAVAGIVPGAAAPGAGAPTGGGALTADQWQALVTGVNRNWEQSQIGQGSALSG